MKIDPISFILNNNIKPIEGFYIISGNEDTLINEVRQKIIYTFKSLGSHNIKRIKNIDAIRGEVGLFDQKTLYIINEIDRIDVKTLDSLAIKSDSYLMVLETPSKKKSLKKLFLERKNSCFLECYEISKDDKIKVLNSYIAKNKISIDDKLYWKIVDRLDNKFGFLKNELEKLINLNKIKLTEGVINKLFSKNIPRSEKIFFEILNSNEKIVNSYNNKVTNNDEVNGFYYIFKYYCMMIINNNNLSDFSNSVPKYLFREKNYLIGIYKKYDHKKKRDLLNLLFKTEKIMRKEGSLSLVLGLRFLLSFKKITIS